MDYRRMPIEVESPEELGYGRILHNLAESSVADVRLADLRLTMDLDRLVLQYGDHRGHPGLRGLLAEEAGCQPNDVLLTPGAAGALFIVATTLLGPTDHLVVIRPNYATNLETPRAIGAEISYLDLEFERGWRYTALKIAALLRSNTTLISIATPHNPTGVVLPAEELERIAALAQSRGVTLLVDETYRDLGPGRTAPWAAALSPRVISVASLSKAYGLPGLRIGWLICQDRALMGRLLAAKEQIVITGPIIEEEIGYQVYRSRADRRPATDALVHRHRGMVKAWVEGHEALEWVEPLGGVVCFPRIRSGVAVDLEAFYRVLLDEHGTYVGAGHWFEQDRRHFRIGYGWPTTASLAAGLAAISLALARSRTS